MKVKYAGVVTRERTETTKKHRAAIDGGFPRFSGAIERDNAQQSRPPAKNS
jgi:hypothetical protein